MRAPSTSPEGIRGYLAETLRASPFLEAMTDAMDRGLPTSAARPASRVSPR